MRLFATIATLIALALPAAAQDRDAIEDVIGSQLQAFNDRDVAEAWTYASPMIQGMFGNPGNFGMMVQQGYPMVWDNRAPDFRDLETREDGRPVQMVYVQDPLGAGYILSYTMIDTPDGWRIDGVSILPAPDVGV